METVKGTTTASGGNGGKKGTTSAGGNSGTTRPTGKPQSTSGR